MDTTSFQQGLYNTGPTANTDWDAYQAGRSTREWNENARKSAEASWNASASSSLSFDWTPTAAAPFANSAASSSGYSYGTGSAGGAHLLTIVALLIGLLATVLAPVAGFNPMSAGITAAILTVLLIFGLLFTVALLKAVLMLVAWVLAPWKWLVPMAVLGAAIGFGFQATADAPSAVIQQTASVGAGAGAVMGFVIGVTARRFRKR